MPAFVQGRVQLAIFPPPREPHSWRSPSYSDQGGSGILHGFISWLSQQLQSFWAVKGYHLVGKELRDLLTQFNCIARLHFIFIENLFI